MGADADDPRAIELVGELSLASPRFRELWGRHDVRTSEGEPMQLDHPQVGELRLNREKLVIGGTGHQMLVVHHPDAGSPSADKLALLAHLGDGDLRPDGGTPKAPTVRR